MTLIKRCNLCDKLLLINFIEYNNLFYCKKCLIIQKQKEIEETKLQEEQKRIYIKKKQERKKLNEKKVNEQLKKDLELEKKKQDKKIKIKKLKELLKKNKKKIIKNKEYKKPKKNHNSSNKIYFSKDEINDNSRLLYIEADIKRILVIDWLKGKKKIILNKEREIRRTHAGGFSAEKFQKFVDFKKKTAYDWIISVLERPGIIRKPYDIIKVRCSDDNFKKGIENFIEQF